jgi:NADPH:quinone reductase-like Zn-dependent oxidoreductase
VIAVVHERYGPPLDVLQMREVIEPTPGSEEVLVSVKAASVNAGDTAVVKGMPYLIRPAYGLSRPRTGIRGSDIAGVVRAVGRDVVGLEIGDVVFGKGEGAFAEMVLAHRDRIAKKPSDVSFDHAAALPVAGLTALQGLRDAGGVQSGQRVLINGASGGVGTFAVQIGKILGADVTAVCSTANVEMARSLGADSVIDYTREDFTATDTRFDVIFDNAASRPLAATRRLLTRRGVLVLNNGNLHSRWLASLPRMARGMLTSPFVAQRIRPNVQRWSREDLAELGGLVATGRMTPVIDRTYALSETAEALEYLDDGHARGKVVVVI